MRSLTVLAAALVACAVVTDRAGGTAAIPSTVTPEEAAVGRAVREDADRADRQWQEHRVSLARLIAAGEEPADPSAPADRPRVLFYSGPMPDGGSYVGWAIGLSPHRLGTYVFPDGRKYRGEWLNGKATGHGTCVFADGRIYEGEWQGGAASGYGTCIYPDGRRYVGQWLDGKHHGLGFVTGLGRERYVGQWQDCKVAGRGTYTWPDGSRYAGQWQDGKQHGQGTFAWPDGRTYVGEWQGGLRQGQGVMTWPDGRRFAGQFAKGRPVEADAPALDAPADREPLPALASLAPAAARTPPPHIRAAIVRER